MAANDISYLLAKVINFSFTDSQPDISHDERVDAWEVLSLNLAEWKNSLPSSFEPYSTAQKTNNEFPSLRMLRPWHGAYVLQYHQHR